jgi:hypothetical protein
MAGSTAAGRESARAAAASPEDASSAPSASTSALPRAAVACAPCSAIASGDAGQPRLLRERRRDLQERGGALGGQRGGRLVPEDDGDVRDAPRFVPERKEGRRHRHPPPFQHLDVLQLARVVPERRRVDGLAGERAPHQLDHAGPLGDLVV